MDTVRSTKGVRSSLRAARLATLPGKAIEFFYGGVLSTAQLGYN
jgi:hypothetical protein